MVRKQSFIVGNGGISSLMRSARLAALQHVVRPFFHFREGETISFAERQADLSLAKVTRKLLGVSGLYSRTACTSFGLMHYYDSAPDSDEVPLVMLHGIGSSGQCYIMLAEILRSKRRVILPDLFHFSGFSSPNNPVMNLSEHTQSVIELFAEIGVKSCDFVGLSLGGWIGQKIAVQSPEIIRKLMLLNSAGLRFGTITLRDRLTYLSWEKFQGYFPGIMYAPPYRGVRIFSPIVRRSLYRLLKDHTVRDFLKSIRPSDFMEPSLASIKCPVLLLWGDRDSFLSHQCPHFYLRHIKDIQAFYVEDCAHILCLEAPANVLEHLDRFFDLHINFDAPLPRLLGSLFGRYEERPVQSRARSSAADEDEPQANYRLSG
jgi:abhydrolase domain-containing protein 6